MTSLPVSLQQLDVEGVVRQATGVAASVVGRGVGAVTDVFALLDRINGTLDDIAELRRSAQIIAASMEHLGESAAGIDANAAKIADQISGLSLAAQGIETNADKLAGGVDGLVAILPTLQRLTEIVDPLDNTVMRLGRFVDRLPGGRRAARRAEAATGR